MMLKRVEQAIQFGEQKKEGIALAGLIPRIRYKARGFFSLLSTEASSSKGQQNEDQRRFSPVFQENLDARNIDQRCF